MYLKLSSRYKETTTSCPNSFCVTIPNTIPNIFPSSSSALPVRDIALEVVEVVMTGLRNCPAGTIFLFKKMPTLQYWSRFAFHYGSTYCATVADLVDHLNEAISAAQLELFKDQFKFTYDTSRSRVKYEFQCSHVEKAALDCAFLVIPAVIAAKMGFSVPTLNSDESAFTKLALYPVSYPLDEIPMVCNFPRCPTSVPTCDIAINTELLEGAEAELFRAQNELLVKQRLLSQSDSEDYTFESYAHFAPNMGSSMNLIEVQLQQQNLSATPPFLKPPNYERKEDKAVICRLNLSQLDRANIKPNDMIVLKPELPNGILCKLKSNRVLISLRDVNGFAVPFDPEGETDIIVRVAAVL